MSSDETTYNCFCFDKRWYLHYGTYAPMWLRRTEKDLLWRRELKEAFTLVNGCKVLFTYQSDSGMSPQEEIIFLVPVRVGAFERVTDEEWDAFDKCIEDYRREHGIVVEKLP